MNPLVGMGDGKCESYGQSRTSLEVGFGAICFQQHLVLFGRISLLVLLFQFIETSLSIRRATAQPYPFRFDRNFVFAPQYDGSIIVETTGRLRWGSDVDLLNLSNVANHLKCSDSEIREIKRQLKEFDSLIFYNRNIKSNPNDASWDAVQRNREKILELLGDRKADELSRMDRYLFFRREGAAEFVMAFCSKQVQIDDATKNELRAREVKIWQDSLEKGTKAWKATLAKIAKMLPDDQQKDWKAFIEFWEQPLIADISVQQFTKKFLEEVQGKEADAGLKDLTIGESELPDGEKAYQETIGFQSQFEMEVDGSWLIRRYSIDPASVLGYQIGYLYSQHERTGKNDLDITSEQFIKMEEKRSDYNRGVELAAGFDTTSGPPYVFKPVNREDFQKRKWELAEKFQAQIWDEILFPFQKEMLVEDAQNRLAKVRGPLTFFDRESVKLLPKHSDLEKAARRELTEFRKNLEAIELSAMSSLYKLVSKYDPGFQLKDRPGYLPPSLFNLYLNNKRHTAEQSTVKRE